MLSSEQNSHINSDLFAVCFVSRFAIGLVARRSAGKRKDPDSTLRFFLPLSSKIVVYGHCLVTSPCTMNETLKWLTSPPILMWKSFWWWQPSIRYKLSLPSHLLGFRSPSLSRKWHRTLHLFNNCKFHQTHYYHFINMCKTACLRRRTQCLSKRSEHSTFCVICGRLIGTVGLFSEILQRMVMMNT